MTDYRTVAWCLPCRPVELFAWNGAGWEWIETPESDAR